MQDDNRLHDVFFYGLYMDEDILKSKGVNPRNPRSAFVFGYKLRIANQATLLKQDNTVAYGMIYSLTHEEIYKLYEGSGLDTYISEAVLARTTSGETLATLTCNLKVIPNENESNNEYLEKLIVCMKKYNLNIPFDK